MEKYTLITGATGGLGGAFVKECLKRGHNLVLTGTKANVLEALEKDIKEKNPEESIEQVKTQE